MESAKGGKTARELGTEKRLGEVAEPLRNGDDASINVTKKEKSTFLGDRWLSTSTGSSISMKALQQEEEL